MTQQERNQQVHDELVREFNALDPRERLRRLIASGILTNDGKLAPEYVAPAGVAPAEPPRDPSKK